MSEQDVKRSQILKRSANSCPSIDNVSSPSGDFESTYEDSFNQLHVYHKTWDCNRELCKVTEYNESLEYSITDEEIEIPGKVQGKITASILEKFPKFSVASLCISESSAQDIRKSVLDYKEESKDNDAKDENFKIEEERIDCSCNTCVIC
jgi:hypothetical protein